MGLKKFYFDKTKEILKLVIFFNTQKCCDILLNTLKQQRYFIKTVQIVFLTENQEDEEILESFDFLEEAF